MTGPALTKAKLTELQDDLETLLDDATPVNVQFNPDSLKVTYSNEMKQADGGDQASGTAGRQFVGKGTTKLALTLWFDVTSMTDNPVDDVRRLTKEVIYFMNPRKAVDETKYIPPGVRFQWGSFIFNGMIEGMEETLEFFSPDGKPLRASISLTLSQQKILVADYTGVENTAKARAGQRPFTSAKQGDSLQNMAGASGKGGDWQSIASANGIEDPLRLSAGAMIDLTRAQKFQADLARRRASARQASISALQSMSARR